MILFCFLINFSCLSKESKYVELHKKIAVNLRHVLTQDLESIHVPVTKDILEMGKLVKVRFYGVIFPPKLKIVFATL